MPPTQINNVLEKLDELRAIFIIAQRAAPFLEEIFLFFKDVATLLDEIDASIRANTDKMPHATSRLESVTQATELATTEILDIVDKALLGLSATQKRVDESSPCVEAMAAADARMIRLLRASLRGRDDALLKKVEVIHEERKLLRRKVGRQISTDRAVIEEARTYLNQIMLSLQVQDITAQQLTAVHHLIESMRTHLGHLVARLGSDGAPFNVVPKAGSSMRVAFDPNAQYDGSGRQQGLTDPVFAVPGQGAAAFRPDKEAATPTSQAQIDQLFNRAPGSTVTLPGVSSSSVEPATGDGVASQAAIDQRFEVAPPPGRASRDDSDKLFQSAS